jgi:putative DNA primase/helicase
MNLAGTLSRLFRVSAEPVVRQQRKHQEQPIVSPPFQSVGFNDFMNIQMPEREMLLDPIIPTASLSMLYAPRGVGKSWLALSIGLAISTGSPLLRWNAPKKRKVVYLDGEMVLPETKSRLQSISQILGVAPTNDHFHILSADNTEAGLCVSSEEGQAQLDPIIDGKDLVILDNLSSLSKTSESSGDSWVGIQDWLMKLRRKGTSVLVVHHAGSNGKQRGTSKREDILDTVIALKKPEDYDQSQLARFHIVYEKLRHRVENATSYEARLENNVWVHSDIREPSQQAKELFAAGMSIRQVSQQLGIPKSSAWRIRQSVMLPETGGDVHAVN